MKTIYTKGILLLTMIAIVASCQKEFNPQNEDSKTQFKADQSSETTDFVQEQTELKSITPHVCNYSVVSYDMVSSGLNKFGEMRISNNDSRIFLTFNTSVEWKFKEIHIYVRNASELASITDYSVLNEATVNKIFTSPSPMYSISSLRNGLPSCLVIFAYATITDNNGNNQRIWAYGTQLPSTKYFMMYNSYCLQNCR
jgi:hypothetical protein